MNIIILFIAYASMLRRDLILCMTILLSIFFTFPAQASDKSHQFDFPVSQVQEGNWQPHRFAQGRVTPSRETVLNAPFPVVVRSVSADVGQKVTRGETIARFDAPILVDLLVNLHNANERADLARQHVQNVRQRFSEKFATRDELLQAEDSLSQADIAMSNAWSNVENALSQLGTDGSRQVLEEQLKQEQAVTIVQRLAQVRAPFSGVVTQRAVAPGSRVPTGGTLYVLADASQVFIEVLIPAIELPEWKHGAAYSSLPDNARVRLSLITQLPSVDRSTGLIALRFQANNLDGRLLNGEWLTVSLAGKLKNVLWVPEGAIVGRAGKVYCIRRLGTTYEPVEVHIGQALDGRVPVFSGLHAGDRVVTENAYLLLYRDLKQIMRFED